jgi:hypothetical protein
VNPYAQSTRTESVPRPHPRNVGRSDSPRCALLLWVPIPQSTAAPARSSFSSSTIEKIATSSPGSVTRKGEVLTSGGAGRQGRASDRDPVYDVVVQLGVQHEHVRLVPGTQPDLLATQHSNPLPRVAAASVPGSREVLINAHAGVPRSTLPRDHADALASFPQPCNFIRALELRRAEANTCGHSGQRRRGRVRPSRPGPPSVGPCKEQGLVRVSVGVDALPLARNPNEVEARMTRLPF